jgi:hypothetical protein
LHAAHPGREFRILDIQFGIHRKLADAAVCTAVWQYLGVKGPWKKPLRGKVQERDFPTPLGNSATSARFPLFPPPRRRRLSFFDFSGKKNS